MFRELIDQHKRFLGILASMFQIAGWATITLMAVDLAVTVSEMIGDVEGLGIVEFVFSRCAWMMFAFILCGFAQFARCVLNSTQYPGWFLRHGTELLYTYAVFLVATHVITQVLVFRLYPREMDWTFLIHELIRILTMLVSLLIMVSLAETARRILPIIKVSRTSS